MSHVSEIQGLPIADLADRFGTPLYVYDGDVLAGSLSALRGALHPDMEVFFSLKANPNISVFAVLHAHGARAEVSSLVELQTVLAAGVDPHDVIFLGPGKSDAELEACVRAGIWAVVVESFDELARLERAAVRLGARQRVLLRINPAFTVQGSRLTMGGKPRQFGIDEQQVLERTRAVAAELRACWIGGIHAYLGTRILDADVIVQNTERVLDLAERVQAATGIELEGVDVGGGAGVAYFDGETDLDLAALADGMKRVVEPFRLRHPDTRLLVESGRYLTATAGTYVARVTGVKESMGESFAVTDGGTHHHMAAVGIGSFVKRNFPFAAITVGGGERPDGSWNITGPLCTPNDTLGKHVPLPALRAGDLVLVQRSGAYGPTASPVHFLSHGAPAEVLVHRGAAHLVRQRDEPQDLLRPQRLLPLD